MNAPEKRKVQIKYLIIPITWHLLYILFSNEFDSTYRVYCDLIFYLGLSVYFIAIGSISFKNLFNEWKNGKKFWIPVFYTLIAMIIAYAFGMLISAVLPNIDTGMNAFKVVNLPALLAFAVTTILLPPIAEEAFYRKGLINFENNISLICTSIIGILLYASEHSLKPLGFIIATIWALPFTISYIRTKNIYVAITAHFICNLAVNGMEVIFIAVKIT